MAHGASQLLLLGGLFMVYRLSRHLADGRESVALAHAEQIWTLQRHLDLPSEQLFQRLALHSTEFVRLANQFYLGVHFPAAVAFLLWVLVRHREHWPRVRNVLILVTGAALVVHIAYPLAPPRFLPQAMPWVEFVDTGKLVGPSAYAAAGDDLANEYAAMPSLHVGWAVLEAWGVVTILRARARWLALAHPVVTTVVVVITANHYWMDGIVATVLVVAAVWITAPGVFTDLRDRVGRRRPTTARCAGRVVPATARGIVSVPGTRQGDRRTTAGTTVGTTAGTTVGTTAGTTVGTTAGTTVGPTAGISPRPAELPAAPLAGRCLRSHDEPAGGRRS